MSAARAIASQRRGTALAVVLIILAALSSFSLAGMRSVTTELAMARNAVYRQAAFEAAASGIALALRAGRFSFERPTIVTESFGPHRAYSVEAIVTYVASTDVPEGSYSIGVRSGLAAHHFEVISTGRAPRNAVSIQRQGFYVVGPPK